MEASAGWTDLCDVCGCGGAGSFWGDGLSAQEHTRVKVTISVSLYKSKNHSKTNHKMAENLDEGVKCLPAYLCRLVGDGFCLGVDHRHLFGSCLCGIKILKE